jgi:hypothetical protein
MGIVLPVVVAVRGDMALMLMPVSTMFVPVIVMLVPVDVVMVPIVMMVKGRGIGHAHR